MEAAKIKQEEKEIMERCDMLTPVIEYYKFSALTIISMLFFVSIPLLCIFIGLVENLVYLVIFGVILIIFAAFGYRQVCKCHQIVNEMISQGRVVSASIDKIVTRNYKVQDEDSTSYYTEYTISFIYKSPYSGRDKTICFIDTVGTDRNYLIKSTAFGEQHRDKDFEVYVTKKSDCEDVLLIMRNIYFIFTVLG